MDLAAGDANRSVGALLDRYELYARATGFSDDHIANTRLCVGLLDQFLGGIKDVRAVTGDDFLRFLADLRERPAWQGMKKEKRRHLSGTSINTYARGVKAFFAWLSKNGIIAQDPLAQIPAPRKPKTIPKVYTEDELIAVSSAVSGLRDRAIYELFLDSGPRLEELSKLDVGDVDIKNGSVKLKGKGGKERFAYFGPVAMESLEAYVKSYRREASKNDPFFVVPKAGRLKASGIQSMLCRLGEKAGLKERLAPHKLRHSFATLSLKYGGNLEYIRKILGHSHIQTTSESYLNVRDEDVSSAHRGFSPLSNLQRTDSNRASARSGGGQPSNQTSQPDVHAGQPSYVGGSHEAQIRMLAQELIGVVRLPSSKDSFIVELRPGQLFLGKDRTVVAITGKGKIRFGPSVAAKGDTDLLHEALRTHLESSGLAQLWPDILAWSRGVADNLKDCHDLLRRVRSSIEDSYHATVVAADDGTSGFLMDFPILVCASAVEQAGGSGHYQSFRYGREGSRLKFGGYQIYVGEPGEDLKPLEDAHIWMRSACAKWKPVRDIARQRVELNDVALAICRQLRKFVAYARLPGRCEFCS